MKVDGAHERELNDHRTSLERYLRMDEKEKDAEIQKAVLRLQKRIQEILYLLDADSPRISVQEKKNKSE